MENIQKQVEEPIENLTPEAKEAEEQALKETPQTELRSQVIEKYGLDEENQSELIDKLVADKVEEKKKFSTVIKQKIGWRNKANKPPEVKTEEVKPPVGEYVTKEELEKRDLDSLELSDELKSETKKYAKMNGISVKEAIKSTYISFLKSEEDKKLKAEEASIGNKRVSQSKKDFSNSTPEDFDRSTPEGRKEWDEYKGWLKTQ